MSEYFDSMVSAEGQVRWLISEYKNPRNDGYVTSGYKQRLQEIVVMIEDALKGDESANRE